MSTPAPEYSVRYWRGQRVHFCLFRSSGRYIVRYWNPDRPELGERWMDDDAFFAATTPAPVFDTAIIYVAA